MAQQKREREREKERERERHTTITDRKGRWDRKNGRRDDILTCFSPSSATSLRCDDEERSLRRGANTSSRIRGPTVKDK